MRAWLHETHGCIKRESMHADGTTEETLLVVFPKHPSTIPVWRQEQSALIGQNTRQITGPAYLVRQAAILDNNVTEVENSDTRTDHENRGRSTRAKGLSRLIAMTVPRYKK